LLKLVGSSLDISVALQNCWWAALWTLVLRYKIVATATGIKHASGPQAGKVLWVMVQLMIYSLLLVCGALQVSRICRIPSGVGQLQQMCRVCVVCLAMQVVADARLQ
jgi:hypothetical protein